MWNQRALYSISIYLLDQEHSFKPDALWLPLVNKFNKYLNSGKTLYSVHFIFQNHVVVRMPPPKVLVAKCLNSSESFFDSQLYSLLFFRQAFKMTYTNNQLLDIYVEH